MNRVLDSDEESALGGYDEQGVLRGPPVIGDHLPRHALELDHPVPRQVVFRESEKGVRAMVSVKEPWVLGPEDIFGEDGPKDADSLSYEAREAFAQLFAFMRAAGTRYAVLTVSADGASRERNRRPGAVNSRRETQVRSFAIVAPHRRTATSFSYATRATSSKCPKSRSPSQSQVPTVKSQSLQRSGTGDVRSRSRSEGRSSNFEGTDGVWGDR